MNKLYLFTLFSFLIIQDAESQCTTGGAAWLSGATSGSMNATGVIAGVNTVNVNTVGTMTGGRPFYSIGSSTWKGFNYASLWLSRARSSFGSNYTSFKLQFPLDSNQMHFRVDNIRGDAFNWETQRVTGFNNGVPVPIDFKDPVNGAYITGGNTINGASTTTSLVQSSMRAFFRSAVDSVVIQQTSSSDWIIAELMIQCDYILPISLSSFTITEINDAVKLEWKNNIESSTLISMQAEHSVDGRQWTPVSNTLPLGGHLSYTAVDMYPVDGMNYYRLKYIYSDGRSMYTEILRINRHENGPFQCAVFPNPANTYMAISFNAAVSRAVIYDSQGRQIRILSTKSGSQQVNTSQWTTGIYYLVVEKQNGELTSRKIFRQ